MNKEMISLEEFLALPTEEVAYFVQAAGPQVCVFPINGTRRWFALEYGHQKWGDSISAYMDISSQNHISLYQMLFEHGIDTLLTPILGPDIFLRGEAYMQKIGATGLARLATGEDFLKFYDEYDVRVHFYGDHRKYLAGTAYAYLSDQFDEVAKKTQDHQRYRLFFGVFANDATETVAEIAIQYYKKYKKIPDRQSLVELYYGEFVEPASLFIGFDKFSAFDYPLLTTGEEDLYFTVAPSPYLKMRLLRTILYDHLFIRRIPEPDYASLTAEDFDWIKSFYKENRERALGVGVIRGGLWLPILNLSQQTYER